MWNNINNLVNLASIIQWISIAMIFFGGILQIGKLFVEKRIGNLKEKDQQRKEIVREQTESNLNNQISTLNYSLIERKSEIEDLKKKTEYVDPYSQPIQSASATVNIIVKSKEESNYHFADAGGYLVFVKGKNELLLFMSNESDGDNITSETVNYRGVFNLDATHPSIGKKLSFLKEAEYLQIQFMSIKKDYEVIEGKVVCVFNGNARLEFSIPKQTMHDQLILVRNINPTINKYLNK